ncbi:hypothetical protein CFC21_000482 [Triticum aestivum]|uniref:Uncharacterized protein n=1 Tax=Triticum aestivum TaxID=4565 RepID=A0A3B5XUA8_WHEAT|nr:hypothetical protein CFC21_000482 [Triticum aestivum]
MSSMDDTTHGGLFVEESKSWPEVVGKSIKEAGEIILKDKHDDDIVVLPAGAQVALDLRPKCVPIFVDTVAETPFTG